MRKNLFSFVSILLLILILLNLDFSKLKDFLFKADILFLVLSFFIYVFSFFFRALRWKIMIENISLKRLFSVVAIHTLSNNVYPARSGELSFIYLLKDFNKSFIASVLLVARLTDILCIALLFCLSLFFLTVNNNYWFFLPVIMCLILLILCSVIFAERLLPSKGYIGKIKNFVIDMKNALFDLEKKLLPIFICSFIIWIVKYIAFYFLAISIFKSFGFTISFWQLVFGVSFSELTTVLPFHNIGGFGTFEAGWAGAYIILGFHRKLAVTSGFIFHSLLLIFSALLGVPFLLSYKFTEKLYSRG